MNRFKPRTENYIIFILSDTVLVKLWKLYGERLRKLWKQVKHKVPHKWRPIAARARQARRFQPKSP